jgi:ribonuclease BN (tRNA processing enzyme)
MRITLLGTGPGVPPIIEGRPHTSLAIESGSSLYIIDAGEGCARSACLKGLDLLSVRAVLISHGHLDHTGGLPNLLWTIEKLFKASDSSIQDNRVIRLFVPRMTIYQAVEGMLDQGGTGFSAPYRLEVQPVREGEIWDDGKIRVKAYPNRHLGAPPVGEEWPSYSFRIEADGKSLVYSADLRDFQELEPMLAEPCDLLLMETAHHDVVELCRFIKERDERIGQLVFTHHGEDILRDSQGECRKAERILGYVPVVAEDGMQFVLSGDGKNA